MSIYLHKVKSRWQPGENTVAYYPLTSTSTVNDMKTSGTKYNLINRGDAVFGMYKGVDCAYLSGSQNANMYNTSLSFVANPTQTVALRFYVEGTNTNQYQVIYHIGQTTRTGLLGSWYKHNTLGLSLSSWDTSPYEVTRNENLALGWHSLINVTNGSSSVQYVDGVLFQTFSNYLTSAQTGISIGATYPGNAESNRYYGYISNIVVEDKAWTAEEAMDYYMFTRGDYYTETQWEPNENTLAYFPFQSDGLDAMGNYTLSNVGTQKTLGRNFTGQTVLNTTPTGINTTLVWMKLNTLGSANYVQVMRLMCWNLCFYVQGNASNPCFRIYIQPNTYEGGNQIINTGQWHLIGITREKNGTTTTLKGYVDGVEYQIFSGTAPQDTADNQGLIFTNQTVDIDMSDFIMESKTWSADEVLSYYYQTRNNYIDDPWYPTKECEIQNIYIGDIGWQPGTNTVLYLPMSDDFDDKTGNNTMSNSGATITTLNGVKCGYFSSSTLTCSANSLATTNKTISVRLYPTQGSGWIIGANHSGNATGDYIMIYTSSPWVLQSVYGGSASDSQASSGVGTNGWHHLCVSGTKIYVDGVNVTSSEGNSGSYNQGYPYTIGRQNSGANTYAGYMSELIVESEVRDASKILSYYNSTKNNYTSHHNASGSAIQ